MLKKHLNFSNFLAVLGIALAIVPIYKEQSVIATSILMTVGIILIVIGFDNIINNYLPPYKYYKIYYDFNILDTEGHRVDITEMQFLRVLKRRIVKGGSGWSALPHNLKVTICHVADYLTPNHNEIMLQPTEITKRGAHYWWDYYYDPPLKRGQKFWIIKRFTVLDEFKNEQCGDDFHSYRSRIKEFEWKVHFPPQRPAKRWWLTADFLPGKEDNYILQEHNEPTTEILCKFTDLKRGAIYNLKWEW